MVILNICHIREGVGKVFRTWPSVSKNARREWADMTLAVAGCVAQAEGAVFSAARLMWT